MITQSKKQIRARIIREIRDFFHSQNFIETDTPTLVRSPGMEPHIRPLKIAGGTAYLPTSPEFAMKRLLAEGYERIFQICKAYRHEPLSSTHNPEFTILEWYRKNSGYESIMDDVEKLFAAIARRIDFQGYPLHESWPRITIEECFRRFAGLELTSLYDVKKFAEVCVNRGWASAEVLSSTELHRPGVWDDLFFRVMLNAVEPALADLKRPVIVYLYPPSQAALSNLITDSRGFVWAKRFEVYAGGFELGNAFDELCDPVEQRKRFEKDMKLRHELYGEGFPPNPIDEEFLSALKNIQSSGGIAMGVDRMVMYFTGAQDIKEILWLESFWDLQN